MISALMYGVCAAAAWWTGLALLDVKPLRAAVQAMIAGALCGAIAFFMEQVFSPHLMFLMEMVIFLLCGFAVSFISKGKWCDGLEAFMLAQCANAVIRIPAGLTMAEMLITAAVILLIVVQVLLIRRRYKEWNCAVSGKDKSSVRRILILSAAACIVLSVATMLSVTDVLRHRGVTGVLCAGLFGCFLWIQALMDACEQEAKTIQTEQQYRSEMLSFLNLIRSQRHDYNFHVQTIAGLIRLGKVDDCLRYVNALEEDAALMNAVLPVRDPAISAMIHSFRLQAVRQGIEIHLSLHYDLSQIATTVYETNKIISNLLQNAIDEVATHEDKSYGIELSILKRGEYCVIRVANRIAGMPSADEISDLYRHGYTTKAGHEGVGLSTLRTLTARYHGTIYTQMDGDVIQFVVRIPIDYTKEPYEEQR